MSEAPISLATPGLYEVLFYFDPNAQQHAESVRKAMTKAHFYRHEFPVVTVAIGDAKKMMVALQQDTEACAKMARQARELLEKIEKQSDDKDWLEKAEKVVILAAPKASARSFDPARLKAYYAARGVDAELQVLPDTGDAAPALIAAAKQAGAQILVAGAFGHPRLQEFIFGGTTRTLLNSDQPSLFLSH